MLETPGSATEGSMTAEQQCRQRPPRRTSTPAVQQAQPRQSQTARWSLRRACASCQRTWAAGRATEQRLSAACACWPLPCGSHGPWRTCSRSGRRLWQP
ncbi:hypothetical protein I4F81_005895 [Pyropia yezoensis]|uniref:Uncharacterized protein n=1 Tax=Pyropia yezoensis TaxID=2788 RepID=A0ACC3C0L0_PYRYE|nr:hypothetical protein I4F81_005895 [Neopyropia yezoensis]